MFYTSEYITEEPDAVLFLIKQGTSGSVGVGLVTGRSTTMALGVKTSMNDLYTYIVTVDSGLAPNPFWGWCSLSVCTPNHQGSAVRPGDWIAGFSPKSTGYKFIYAMEVYEKIHMDDYFNDPRFQAKKPVMDGGWKQRCGDNLYSQNEDGIWNQLSNLFHQELVEKDTRNPYVFVGKEFWYLGKARADLPPEFLSMVGGRGARVNHQKGLPEQFIKWVRSNFAPGVAADPLDAEPISYKSCSPGLNNDCLDSRKKTLTKCC